MNKNPVTEQDIRLPQFRDAKLEDLEFDGSGEVVRKDRFETSMRKISGMLHGVNGLSARSGWTCEQVVEAVDQLLRFKQLVIAINTAPDEAEFYHFENGEFIKDIDQEHLQIARDDPKKSYLVNHDVFLNGSWELTSAWIEYINHFSVHDKFHRILVLSGFFFLKIASTFLNSSFFPKPIKRRIAI